MCLKKNYAWFYFLLFVICEGRGCHKPSLGFFLEVVSSNGTEDVSQTAASPECDSLAATLLGSNLAFTSRESAPSMLL